MKEKGTPAWAIWMQDLIMQEALKGYERDPGPLDIESHTGPLLPESYFEVGQWDHRKRSQEEEEGAGP